MKTNRITALLAGVLLLITLAIPFTGCKTTSKAIATSSITMDAAMQGWAVWVADGHATAAQRARVSAALDKYHAAEDAAVAALVAASEPNDPALTQARKALVAAQADLLTILQTFQGSKP